MGDDARQLVDLYLKDTINIKDKNLNKQIIP